MDFSGNKDFGQAETFCMWPVDMEHCGQSNLFCFAAVQQTRGEVVR